MLFGHIYVDPSSTPHRTQSDHMSALLVHRVCANCTSHALHVYTNLRMKESFHDSRASAVKTKFKNYPLLGEFVGFLGISVESGILLASIPVSCVRYGFAMCSMHHGPCLFHVCCFHSLVQTVKWEAEETVDIQMHTAVLTSTSSMRIPVI